jgi:hypothetical protein
MQYDLGMLGMGMNTLSVFWSYGMNNCVDKDIYWKCVERYELA